MRSLAVVRMMELPDGSPGVKIEASDEFMELEPVERATFFNAALQLCAVALDAIINDNPDYEDEIMDQIDAMEIQPSKKGMN